MCLKATDTVLPVVPMFHVNAWGLPYAAAMVGCKLVMPGHHLDGASLYNLFEEEKVTMSAGVPTIWLGLLNHVEGMMQAVVEQGRSEVLTELVEDVGFGAKAIHEEQTRLRRRK